MPALIPGNSESYPTEVQVPVDGDTANAASVATGMAQLADRTANLNARLDAGGGGGGGGAPVNATYLTASSNATLTNETVVPAAGLALLAATDAAGQRTALELGTAATADTADFDSAGSAAAAQAASLPLHGTADDSAKLGGVTPTVAGLALLDDVNAAAQRTTLGLGDSATKNVGTAAGTVAAGDHTHTTLPTSDEKAALAGTSGTPSATNKFVTDDDSRLTGGLAAALTVSAFGGF